VLYAGYSQQFTCIFPKFSSVNVNPFGAPMSTRLSIQVLSATRPAKREVEFLYNEKWTSGAEEMLLQKVREILSLVRNDGNSLHLILEVDVKDPEQAFFLISKKFGHPVELTRNQKLSLREIEILGLIMLGNTNKQIAERLFISYETVKSHRKHILEKTGAKNTAALINYYHQTFFEK
jgi:DNA-binding CsgD family transcriptional regulator